MFSSSPSPAAPHGAVGTPPPLPQRVPQASTTLEAKLGLKVAAWVGGIIIVLAMLFLLKLGWEAGWFRPSPAARFATGLLVGAVMVGLGHWALLRKMKPLAAALQGGGIVVLMASFFTAHAAFTPPVISRAVAGGGVLLVGILGIALALHSRIIATAILALIGLYISPAILRSGQDSFVTFMAYLGLVTAMALAVTLVRRRWHAVRWLALVGTWGWTLLAFTLPFLSAHRDVAIGAAVAFFGMFLGEAVLNLSLRMRGPADEEADGIARPESRNTLILEAQASLLTFFNTALAMIALAMAFTWTRTPGLWAAALALAGAHALVIFATPSRSFAAAAAIQMAALVTLAVPLYFTGASITLAWGLLSICLAVYAYTSQRLAARLWSIALLAFVVARLATFDLFDGSLTQTRLMLGRQGFTWWLALALAAGAFGLAMRILLARRMGAATPDSPAPGIQIGRSGFALAGGIIGSAILAFAGARELAFGAEFSLAIAALLAVAAWLLDARDSRIACLLVLGLAMARLTFIDPLGSEGRNPLSTPWSDDLVLHLGANAVYRWAIIGVVAALLAQAIAWLVGPQRRRDNAVHGESWAGSVAAAMGTACFVLIAARTLTSTSPLTLAWITWIFALLGLRKLLPAVGYDWLAIGLVALTGFKWFALDALSPWTGIYDLSRLRFAPVADASAPLLNLFVLNGALLVLALMLLPFVASGAASVVRTAKAWLIAAMVFLVLNVETIRTVDWMMREAIAGIGSPWIVKNVALSVLWAVVAFGCVLLGFARRNAAMRWVGLVLLGITTAKVLLVDMANVHTVLRVLTFIVVGALLLGVSYVYHRQASRLKADPA